MARARGIGFLFHSRYKEKGVTKIAATWSIRYPANGKVITESTGSTVKADAERLLKKRLATSVTRPENLRLKFGDLAEMLVNDYVVNNRKSLRRVEQSLKHLREHFGNDYIADRFDKAALDRYVKSRRPAANGTINRELTALKTAMHIAKLNPDIAMLSEPAARKGFFDLSQVEQIANELPPYFKNVLRFAYLTGWRAREITTRKWSHVDFTAGWIRLEPGETKNDDGRNFPMTPELRLLLEAQQTRCQEIAAASGVPVTWVFSYDDGRGPIGQYDSIWRRACKRAGLEGKLLHDCRRSAVRNLERAGVPRSAAMQITGHKTQSIYERYAIVDDEMMKDAGAALATFHAAEKRSFPMTPAEVDRLAATVKARG